jgi:hypothetical protein
VTRCSKGGSIAIKYGNGSTDANYMRENKLNIPLNVVRVLMFSRFDVLVCRAPIARRSSH